MNEIVAKRVKDMEMYLIKISKKVKHDIIPDMIINECKNQVTQDISSSTKYYFEENQFF